MCRRHFLEALLLTSVTPEQPLLPSIKEFILSEVAQGTLEYIGGDPGRVLYRGNPNDDSFEKNLFDSLEKELRAHPGRLSSDAERNIRTLCEPYRVDPPRDRPYVSTELYEFFGTGFSPICTESSSSTFSLPYHTVIRLQNEVIPSFSGNVLRDIQGIGKAMRIYIALDIQHIKETYHY